MDKICIKDLEVYCNHGVFPEENRLGQKFVVSATLYVDTREAGLADNLAKSVSYGDVCHDIYDFLRGNTYKLIERAAEELGAYLLKKHSGLERIKLEIKKPWAPIGLSLKYASVEIERGWHTVYIGMGSNVGNKRKYIEDAIDAVNKTDGCRVLKVSELIVTKPYGVEGQEDFLNGCMEIKTLLLPKELLGRLREIEKDAGRERKERWGPRTLDLDILLYDDLIVSDAELTIPHVDMHNRGFVLEPLSTIAPYKLHPVFLKTIRQLKEACLGNNSAIN